VFGNEHLESSREIMIHSRPDYNARFQDAEGKVPADEPVVLLRGQDSLAIKAVGFYVDLAEMNGLTDITKTMREHLELMKAWPIKKLPDMPINGIIEIAMNDKMKETNPALSDSTMLMCAAVTGILKINGATVTGITTQQGVDVVYVSYANPKCELDDVFCYEIQGVEVSSC